MLQYLGFLFTKQMNMFTSDIYIAIKNLKFELNKPNFLNS